LQPSASADDKGAAPDLSLNPNGASEGPVPSPIQFVNEQSDEIFIAAEEGAEGDIAYTLLRNPVDSVNIPLSSKVGRFALYGTVAYEDRDTAIKVFRVLSETLRQQGDAAGKPIDERGGNLIIDAPNDTKLVVGRGRRSAKSNCVPRRNGLHSTKP
jgi:hypothetical protein